MRECSKRNELQRYDDNFIDAFLPFPSRYSFRKHTFYTYSYARLIWCFIRFQYVCEYIYLLCVCLCMYQRFCAAHSSASFLSFFVCSAFIVMIFDIFIGFCIFKSMCISHSLCVCIYSSVVDIKQFAFFVFDDLLELSESYLRGAHMNLMDFIWYFDWICSSFFIRDSFYTLAEKSLFSWAVQLFSQRASLIPSGK